MTFPAALTPKIATPFLSFSRLAGLIGASVLLALSIIGAERPTLKASLSPGDGSVRLELLGSNGTNYVIESSADLSAWARVMDGIAVNGVLATEVTFQAGGGKLFFRGREAGAATGSFPTNVVLAGNTNLSVTTLVTTNGGSAVLYATDGTEYHFTVPALTLPEPQLITMTLVTNIGGLPFAGGAIGAVSLEPSNLEFWGAATLRISLRPEIDRRKVVSFGANGDGTEFHLTPDRVTTNGVVIPIVQLGVYGSAVAELSEISAASAFGLEALDAAGAEEMARAGMQKASVNLNDCFPERTQIALVVSRNLGRHIRAASQDIATALAEARQAQLLGAAEDTFVVNDVLNGEDPGCAFIRDRIQPYFADAASNCELMKVLLSRTLGMERQRQLLGADPNPACNNLLADLPLCPGVQNCLKEIELCCLGGKKGPGKIAGILALSRQDQLLARGCLSQSAIDEAIEACSSNAWTGTISFDAHSERVVTDSGADWSSIETEKLDAQFYGEVWESQEIIFPGVGGTVHLRVRGRVTWNEYYNDTFERSGVCGGYKSINESKTVAASDTWFRVDLTLNPGGTYGLMAAHFDNNTGIAGAEGIDTDLYFTRTGVRVEGQCEERVESTTSTHRDVVLIPPVMFNGTMSDTNTVTGGADVEKFTDFPPTDGRYEWDFKRHRVE